MAGRRNVYVLGGLAALALGFQAFRHRRKLLKAAKRVAGLVGPNQAAPRERADCAPHLHGGASEGVTLSSADADTLCEPNSDDDASAGTRAEVASVHDASTGASDGDVLSSPGVPEVTADLAEAAASTTANDGSATASDTGASSSGTCAAASRDPAPETRKPMLGHSAVHMITRPSWLSRRDFLGAALRAGTRTLVNLVLLCCAVGACFSGGLGLAEAALREFGRGARVLLAVVALLACATGAAMRVEAAACRRLCCEAACEQPPPGKSRRRRRSFRRTSAFQATIAALSLLGPTALVVWRNPGTLAAFAALAAAVVFFMEITSFQHFMCSWRAAAHQSATAAFDARAATNARASMTAPTMCAFSWYLAAPTLVYQATYPSKPRSAARACLLAAQLALCALAGLELVLLAEFTGFGDTQFFADWWNSPTTREFWKR
ncbi:hypothetical protein WJX81_006645 [Elliptochloris bilobata]|uniref:diacylglycerol O-acyltransferase n=1 Tax=Elliptochloris bilobata TaxID=381761 RepID=A0AAW1RKE3_9CHLO